MEGIHQKCTLSKEVYNFMYTLHFSSVHSQTMIDVTHMIFVIYKSLDLRCASVIYQIQCIKLCYCDTYSITEIQCKLATLIYISPVSLYKVLLKLILSSRAHKKGYLQSEMLCIFTSNILSCSVYRLFYWSVQNIRMFYQSIVIEFIIVDHCTFN